MNEAQARKRVKDIQGFWGHLGAFLGVNLFLFMVNMTSYSGHGDVWFVYPLFGWGIGLICHGFTIFGNRWAEQKTQELVGMSTTRDEVERLSERMEHLVTILSSVDWSKIDRDMDDAKDNLQQASRQIAELKDGASGMAPDQVRKEIERLEAFVTSSKFDYYEKASRDH